MLALGAASQTLTVARPATWINFARRLRNRGSRLHTAHRSLGQVSAGCLECKSEAVGKSFSPALRSSHVQCRSSNNSVTGNSDIFLIIYSKPGCHLCDGLKVRNILDEPAWEAAYGMVIPVLTAIKSGEKEEIKIPRAPPRITADRLADHIAKSLKL